MIEMESGASGISTVERATRCAPESCHSIVVRASPGHGGPSGGLASRVHSPTSTSSRLSASCAVGWSIASLLSRAIRFAHRLLGAYGNGLKTSIDSRNHECFCRDGSATALCHICGYIPLNRSIGEEIASAKFAEYPFHAL